MVKRNLIVIAATLVACESDPLKPGPDESHLAHTVSVDPQSHRVYFPLENLRGRAVLRIMEGP